MEGNRGGGGRGGTKGVGCVPSEERRTTKILKWSRWGLGERGRWG